MPKTLEEAITKDFGSVEKFKEAFQTSGANNFGSGWTWLCVDPKSGKLVLHNTSNAGCPLTEGLRPIFTADVWEHAYYKDFENRRPDYLKELWKVVNWEYVAQQLTNAKK
ncbi:superoxide dismutase, Fe-Mn family [Angomonas deanei]|nr:superoxide dismutase, Fe-Mn family [Angomonas deanei]EPY43142.1 superoxide dismutase, Fe-Mn family [Angomonas deanei]|eukprot:EPY42865.1 superoxide dismutase, Fe-Mn family [Angomonas deanei]